MHLASVAVDHPEVRVIQPTWHCLQRFRERHALAAGTQAAVDGLRGALRGAKITTQPPRGVRAPGDWSLWAVCGDLAFPLVADGEGRFTATTCLSAGSRRGSVRRAAF